jgi:hypothetical protein
MRLKNCITGRKTHLTPGPSRCGGTSSPAGEGCPCVTLISQRGETHEKEKAARLFSCGFIIGCKLSFLSPPPNLPKGRTVRGDFYFEG